ncbi:hypothetical protein [Cellulomonas sp. SLBN-39]|uniref:hypothetical protein n=1 Tax=Cellulomonas sp. SLBN-39 TaxID=2768446 RepID=UPI00114F783B|nr:hypothetical protein [Cellulomonas sp. SLBN-39]
MVVDWEQLDVARRRFPVGRQVPGTVTRMPQPGAIGLFVSLGETPEGFVDVLALPRDPHLWPPPGTTMGFEVLQHRPGQVRLWPVDPRWRHADARDDQESITWARTKSRYREGQLVTARVTHVVTGNREYMVAFGDDHAVLEWSYERPTLGTTGTFRVEALLDTTRRILLAPVELSES